MNTDLRFTRDGSIALETHLTEVCEAVRDTITRIVPASRLEGLALGGGYGRGEGGVLRSTSGDAPYNDIEFFVFIRGSTLLNERRYSAALHREGHRLSEQAGVEVEFKILSLNQLRQSQTTMFYYDLLMGHRWLIGDDTLFAGCDAHRDAKNIPLHEATRLLMNRSSGLLFARERLAQSDFTAEDADFVARNIAKAQLALGDVFLAAHGFYHWSCLERHSRLRALTGRKSLIAHHAAGVEFKLHPYASKATREELAVQHTKVTAAAAQLFLWVESRRLRASFRDLQSYRESHIDKCPETRPLRNRLINARHFGLPALLNPRYPRQSLLHGLCDLLWQNDCAPDPSLVAAYQQIWQRFN